MYKPTIDASAKLENVVIFARSVIVSSGFHGTCQLFATDSIHIHSGCRFGYPSCLGVLNTNSSKISPYVRITLDRDNIFSGALFTYRSAVDDIMPILSLDSNVTVNGQIYSQGALQFRRSLQVNGSIYTRMFTYQNGSNLMENTLVDAAISTRSLSPYYLSGELFPVSKRKKILKWLE